MKEETMQQFNTVFEGEVVEMYDHIADIWSYIKSIKKALKTSILKHYFVQGRKCLNRLRKIKGNF